MSLGDRTISRDGIPAGAVVMRKAGFTIIEVLATLVFAGVILPVVVDGVMVSMATSVHARQQAEAAQLAQTKLAELIATGEIDESEMEGDFGEDWPDYHWVSILDNWEEDDRLDQLSVGVFWTRRGKEYHVLVSTLVYTGGESE
jgi:hypothetical protein